MLQQARTEDVEVKRSDSLRAILRTAKHLSNSGDDRAALKILDNAQKNTRNARQKKWIMYKKACLLLELEGLEVARELAMDLLAPDSPINDIAKTDLRGRILTAMSEANDVVGLARLLPDQLLCDANHALHRQAMQIQEHHGLALDPRTITPGETPPPQSVLSERRISYRMPAKTRYPTKIKQYLDDNNRYAPAAKLYTLTKCTAIFWNGYAFFFDAAGGFIRKCSDQLPVTLMNGLIKDLLKEAPLLHAIPGVSAYIGDRFRGGNYCHWILDWLPRLLLCERAGPFENIVDVELKHDFMRESLAFLGYQDKTIIAGGHSACVWRFETLLVPDSTSSGKIRTIINFLKGISTPQRKLYHPMLHCHPDLLQWWRSKCPARKPHRKLYIPRTNKRVVLNEADLLDLLDDFESFDPGQHSFTKQMKIFSEAKMVVGAHGAGLTNLLFAPEGCRVLELFPHKGGSAAFFCLATALNHDYDLVMSEGPPPRLGEREPNDLSFTVPLEKIRQWLQGSIPESPQSNL